MSENWKHIARKATLGLLLIGVLVGAYLLGASRKGKTVCNRIDITILDSLKTPFVTSESIRQYLSTDYGRIIGVPIDSLDLHRMENVLNNKGAILSSEAYITNAGTLSITITQRKPALRFQTAEYGVYCDVDGFLLPLQPNFSTDVLIIDGHIPLDMADCEKGRPEDPADCMWLDSILKMASYINSSSIWNNRIAQINCNGSGELTIVPKDGKEIFLFGHPDEIEQKFEKMKIYYERIVAEKGEEAYDKVDLRFKNQIVCKNSEQKKK